MKRDFGIDLFVWSQEGVCLNKYMKLYVDIIHSRLLKNRKKHNGEYLETHHIVPKSILTNTNYPARKTVLLTAREHFLCHKLLTKFTFGKTRTKMLKAVTFFQCDLNDGRILRSKDYEFIKICNSESMIGKNNPAYGRTPWNCGKRYKNPKISEANKGKSIPPEQRAKISRSLKGRKKPVGFGEHISKTCRGKNHNAFRGYYITPFGKFESSTEAKRIAGKVPNQLIRKWCKNNKKTITVYCFSQSDYLKSIGNSVIGKTFKEIGFDFEQNETTRNN
jgi:hypothetical protein